VLVFDEPTNDLDLETLELVESQLVEWSGTLLLVTHDRAFLDNVVTSSMVLDDDGGVQEYVGGYEDWLRQSNAERAIETARRPAKLGLAMANGDARSIERSSTAPRKLSFKEQRELEGLPARIDALEAEDRQLNVAIHDPDFYREPAENIRRTLKRLADVHRELAAAYARWDELDSLTVRP
jgi:ATP-binding cassette subfamily F protein uup